MRAAFPASAHGPPRGAADPIYLHLTTRGYADMVARGGWVKERYIDTLGLLPPHPDPALIRVRSTDVTRTVWARVFMWAGARTGV